MMQIQLNGAPFELTGATSLADLVDQLNLQGKRFAVEVNSELVPRSEHASHELQASDKVEIVQAIGGG